MDTWLWIILFPIALYIYFVPTFMAKANNHRNFMSVMLLNVLLGWTFLGWAAALVWAAMKSEHQPDKPAAFPN